MTTKTEDLAGPGISTYEAVADVLPKDYQPTLLAKERAKAIFRVKSFIEDNLNRELGLFMVPVPLVVSRQSGVNDYLDRDGSRTPVEFPAGLGLDKPIDAQVVQAATKWKRMALKQFDCAAGEGINTDMRAIRKDYFLDHDHSCYVDQWDWEKVITPQQRNLDYLRNTVETIWSVIYQSSRLLKLDFPGLGTDRYPDIPEKLAFFHAEEILQRYPDLPRKERETRMITEVAPAIFIIGIGHVLADGYPHELRAADYDDWMTPTVEKNGVQCHGLNGDILVWNPVTQRRHELTSMGVRVTPETLVQQLAESGQEELLQLPYHQAIMNNQIPLSIGGGIGQSRTYMYLLRSAHLGEVSVSVWPQQLKDICEERHIRLLE